MRPVAANRLLPGWIFLADAASSCGVSSSRPIAVAPSRAGNRKRALLWHSGPRWRVEITFQPLKIRAEDLTARRREPPAKREPGLPEAVVAQYCAILVIVGSIRRYLAAFFLRRRPASDSGDNMSKEMWRAVRQLMLAVRLTYWPIHAPAQAGRKASSKVSLLQSFFKKTGERFGVANSYEAWVSKMGVTDVIRLTSMNRLDRQ